ncbi:MAG: hypothetical protein JKY24_08890, partial [Pseudomonadales bacterium]|nr:hypothetical protein [Pseudomonadales bacterium]
MLEGNAMQSLNVSKNINLLYKKMNGIKTEYGMKPYQPIITQIHQKTEEVDQLSKEEIVDYTKDLVRKAKEGTPLDDLLVDSFAATFVAISRVLKLEAHDEQLVAGIALHQGKLVEMQTGEG